MTRNVEIVQEALDLAAGYTALDEEHAKIVDAGTSALAELAADLEDEKGKSRASWRSAVEAQDRAEAAEKSLAEYVRPQAGSVYSLLTEDALAALYDISTCIMSADHGDNNTKFLQALRATNALHDYFSALRQLEKLERRR